MIFSACVSKPEAVGMQSCLEKFKVQGSRFKVKSKGRHELFMIYRWAKGP
jgi:hypothetical protein